MRPGAPRSGFQGKLFSFSDRFTYWELARTTQRHFVLLSNPEKITEIVIHSRIFFTNFGWFSSLSFFSLKFYAQILSLLSEFKNKHLLFITARRKNITNLQMNLFCRCFVSPEIQCLFVWPIKVLNYNTTIQLVANVFGP